MKFNMETVKNISSILIGSILGFLGGADALLKALIIFMAIDYITGILASVINKKINSRIGFIGIMKKVLILLIVAVSVQLDNIMNTTVVRSMTIFFYIANEGISILENTAKSGIKYPKKLIEILEQLNDNKEGGQSEK